jgi:ribosomal protein S18 acetylase RimI-like enzyme
VPPLISFRSFLNTDPPLLVEVWRRQKRFRGLADRVSGATLEELVFSKPYFDPAGLILAVNGDQPLGFVHAGFGPNRERQDLDNSTGVISALRVVENADSEEVARGLLERALAYLSERGAKVVYAGSAFPFAPYYLGLYGGSRVPGVLDDDLSARRGLLAAGFDKSDEILIFQRHLAGYRTLVDRQQMAVRRQYHMNSNTDPDSSNWWDACTLGSTLRTRFSLSDRKSNDEVAVVTFWDMQPLASCWGVTAMGLYDLQVNAEARRCGLGTFLVCESLRALSQQGISLVEAQVRQADAIACNMFQKLGFAQVGSGHIFQTTLSQVGA